MPRDAVIVICSRPESTRLPYKVFRKIAGIPVIEHILNRLNGCGMTVVLAIPPYCDDYNYLVTKYKDLKVVIFHGNSESPLHRMADAVDQLELKNKWIVRITHDDILIDQKTMLDLIDECQKTPGCGYGISPAIVEGAGVEVIHRENLMHAAKHRRAWTEYVSYFVKTDPYFRNANHIPRKEICRPYRLTLDYLEDAVVLETIFREVGNKASVDTVCEFLDRHPYIMRINAQPKISIYTCAYNAESYVERTMDSILSHHQYADFEYIFLDDGSTDSTLLKASKYGYDKRVKYLVNQINQGLATSSNTALTAARGKYVMRVDADDMLLPYSMTTMLDMMESDSSSVVYPAFKEIDDKEQVISDVKKPSENHHAGCALMDKRMINEIRFTDGLKHWDSKDLYNRIKNKFKKSYTQEPLWYYRKHSKSLSANKTAERERALREIMKNG